MAWDDKRFSDQYSAAKAVLAKSKDFNPEWQKLIDGLYRLMMPTGFLGGRAEYLNDLRRQIKTSSNNGKICPADEAILRACACWLDAMPATFDAAGRARAAALKFLMHTYLMRERGGHKVWILSLPNAFNDWPHWELQTGSAQQVCQLLLAHEERFSAEQKKHLSNASQEALRWCHKAKILLSSAATNMVARKTVKRWFADENSTDDQLTATISTLLAGFKSLIFTLNKGLLITDFPTLRNAKPGSMEYDLLMLSAFVWPTSDREALSVVYVEDAFFNGNRDLPGQAYWTRILIHELSHLICNTCDVDNVRYAWYGIGPNRARFSAEKALSNADSWAFFAGDCANALDASAVAIALRQR